MIRFDISAEFFYSLGLSAVRLNLHKYYPGKHEILINY